MSAQLREADCAQTSNSIVCGGCESRFLLLPGQKLPLRWAMVDGVALCSDCAPAPAESLKASLCRRHDRVIGPRESSRYRGCRVAHVIQLGMVGLEFRAGTSAPSGRDEPVAFMLDELGIDQLIAELRSIREDLAESKRLGQPERISACAR